MKTTVINMRHHRQCNYIRIDRNSKFGNQYRIGWYYKRTKKGIVQKPHPFPGAKVITRPIAIGLYRKYFYNRIKRDRKFRWAVQDLKGNYIGCWCSPLSCHGDIIIEYLEG